jgi:hypothetical protein
MRSLASVGACAVLLVGAACVHRPAAPAGSLAAVPESPSVDVAPRLLGCTKYSAPVAGREGARRREKVRVSFLVNADGTVAPGSVQPVMSRFTRRTGPAVDVALEQALTCRYEPALRNGQPVAARTSYEFIYTS